ARRAGGVGGGSAGRGSDLGLVCLVPSALQEPESRRHGAQGRKAADPRDADQLPGRVRGAVGSPGAGGVEPPAGGAAGFDSNGLVDGLAGVEVGPGVGAGGIGPAESVAGPSDAPGADAGAEVVVGPL